MRDDTGLDQVRAGAHQHPQPHGGLGIGGQRGQTPAVGAQHVGEQVGIEAVVLVPGDAIAGAQGGDLPARDDEHGQAGLEQGRHHRAVAAFDRDPADLMAVQHGDQLGQPGRGVRDGKPLDRSAGVVDDAHRVFGPRPVHPGPPDRPATGAVVAATCRFRLRHRRRCSRRGGERPRSGAAAGRSLKRSRRTTPSPVSTPHPVGPRVVKAGLEGHPSLGDDPTVRDAHRTRRARQIQLALSDLRASTAPPGRACGQAGGLPGRRAAPPNLGRRVAAGEDRGSKGVPGAACRRVWEPGAANRTVCARSRGHGAGCARRAPQLIV